MIAWLSEKQPSEDVIVSYFEMVLNLHYGSFCWILSSSPFAINLKNILNDILTFS